MIFQFLKTKLLLCKMIAVKYNLDLKRINNIINDLFL